MPSKLVIPCDAARAAQKRRSSSSSDSSIASSPISLEDEAMLFLFDQRERILGESYAFLGSCKDMRRYSITRARLEKLEGAYSGHMRALQRIKERTEHLRRSLDALSIVSGRRKFRVGSNRMIEKVILELEEREEEEEEALDRIFEVALQIAELPSL